VRMRVRSLPAAAAILFVFLAAVGCGSGDDNSGDLGPGETSSAAPSRTLEGEIVGELSQAVHDTVSIGDNQVTAPHTPLREGDRLKTDPQGNGQFKTDERFDCTMAGDTEVVIHPTADYAQSWERGHGDCSLPNSQPKVTIKIETPKPYHISISGDLVFGIDVRDDRTVIAVFSGLLTIEARGQVQVIGPNLEVVADESGLKVGALPDSIFGADEKVIAGYVREQQTPDLHASSIRGQSPVMDYILQRSTARVCILGDQSVRQMSDAVLNTLFSMWFPDREVSPVETCPDKVSDLSKLFADYQYAFVIGPDAQLAPQARVTFFRAPRPTSLTHVVPPGLDTWSLAFRAGDDVFANFVRDSVLYGFLGNPDDGGYSALYRNLFGGVPSFEGLANNLRP
jgi:hypothetical protein